MGMLRKLRLLFDKYILRVARTVHIKPAYIDNFGISAKDVQERIVEGTYTAEEHNRLIRTMPTFLEDDPKNHMKTIYQIEQEIEKLKKRKELILLRSEDDATDYIVLVNRIATLQWVIAPPTSDHT